MSRIGREPITIPAGVTVDVKDGFIIVKGPKGELKQDYDSKVITITIDGGVLHVKRANDLGPVRAKHGLYRALINNMIKGVTEGFSKTLVVNGVGWKVNMQGEKLILNVGFSHPVEFTALNGVKLACPSQTEITVSGIDKVNVGQVAASIRDIRKPEPYHGYGIRYNDEVIERKEGKTAGK